MAKPELTRAEYDGKELYAEWQVEIPPRFTGFIVTVTEKGGEAKNYPTTSAMIRQSMTLSASKTYLISIVVMVQDQPSSKSDPTTLITAAPTLYQVWYTNAPVLLSLKWKSATGGGAQGIEAYLATLSEFGKRTWNESTEGNALTFDQTLSENETYSCVVRGTNALGNVMGPPSTDYAPIVGTPRIGNITYDNVPSSLLQIYWAEVKGTDIQYIAVLQELGKNTWNNQTAELNTSFDKVLSTTESYSVTLFATDSTGVVMGPPSTVYAPICVTPEASLLAYDAEVLTLSWGAAIGEGVEGYLAKFEQVGSTASFSATTNLNTSFNQKLVVGPTYNVSVRATDSEQIVLGPSSEILNPLLSLPTSFSLFYTGTQISSNWTNDTNPVTTGYIIELDKDGSKLDEKTATVPPSNFDTTLANGSVYKCRIRSTGNKLEGPWSEWEYTPFATSISVTYDNLSRLKTMVWNASSTVSYSIDEAGNILTQTRS